ncbi:MAG: hypothetical protein ABIO16_02645 [Nocardioides sp.]
MTRLRDDRAFVIALSVAAVVRLAVVVAFPPGFVFSDGPTYLALVDDLQPLADRASGYGFLLDGLNAVSRSVWLVTAVQHVLGLVTAIVLYALMRRWSVPPLLATLACLPVLFDAMQLSLEHSVLSDVLFDLLVVGGVAALAWHRSPRVPTAALGGLLLGAAVCVRVVGEPLLVVAIVFCLWAASTWRAKLVAALVVALAFAAPVAAYTAWYHAEHGVWAMSESGGRALYMRTTGFVDCSRFTMPDYERPLCPAEPLGSRLDPTEYGWHTPNGTHGLVLPAGVTPNQAMHDFAVRAIQAQPWDYLRIVARDVMLNFTVPRIDRYEYDTASKWRLQTYEDFQQTGWTYPAYVAHGGTVLHAEQPLAGWLGWYGFTVYAWGPLLFLLTLLSLVALLAPTRWLRRDEVPSRDRPLLFLVLATAAGLLLVPAVTAQFVWRYQLPFLVLVPAAAVLALVRTQSGTRPTPRTDWPNGGVTRRSTKRVVGTTNRS